MNQEILLDVGGNVVFDCPQGRATGTPSATLHKADGTSLDATPTVTNDSANTTLTAAAAVGATSLTVASATGITAGRRYLLDNTLNEPEWVTVKSVSGTTVTLHAPIAYVCAGAGAETFVGTRLSCAVTSGNSDTRGEGYECRWTYAVGGVTYKPISRFDVVRNLWPPEGQLAATWEFLEYASGLADDELEADDAGGLDFGRDLLIADRNLRRDLLARGTKHSRYRDSEDFKTCLFERVLYEWALKGINIPGPYQDDPETWLNIRERSYRAALVDAMNTSRDYDADESGVVSEKEREDLIGTLRMVR